MGMHQYAKVCALLVLYLVNVAAGPDTSFSQLPAIEQDHRLHIAAKLPDYLQGVPEPQQVIIFNVF